jgi:hypothetical protein
MNHKQSVTRAATRHTAARAKLRKAIQDAYPNMSSRELAALAGVSHQTILNWWKEKQQ